MKGMWKVYPSERVDGFCATYCKSEISAEWEALKLEIETGVEWNVMYVVVEETKCKGIKLVTL